jgi:Malectin domain
MSLQSKSYITTVFLLAHAGPLYLEDSGLRYWADDNFFTGGTTYSISSVPIANTADDVLFQSIRLGSFSYSIPVPLGHYEVVLHFAEL